MRTSEKLYNGLECWIIGWLEFAVFGSKAVESRATEIEIVVLGAFKPEPMASGAMGMGVTAMGVTEMTLEVLELEVIELGAMGTGAVGTRTVMSDVLELEPMESGAMETGVTETTSDVLELEVIESGTTGTGAVGTRAMGTRTVMSDVLELEAVESGAVETGAVGTRTVVSGTTPGTLGSAKKVIINKNLYPKDFLTFGSLFLLERYISVLCLQFSFLPFCLRQPIPLGVYMACAPCRVACPCHSIELPSTFRIFEKRPGFFHVRMKKLSPCGV